MSGEVEAARVRQRQEARAEELASVGTDEALETLASNGYGNVGARGLLFLADREGLYTGGAGHRGSRLTQPRPVRR